MKKTINILLVALVVLLISSCKTETKTENNATAPNKGNSESSGVIGFLGLLLTGYSLLK